MSLAAKHIVITRPAHQSATIKRLLEEQQARVTLFPVIGIRSNSVDLTHVKHADWLIFISANAVKYGLKQLKTSDLQGKTIAAIGKKTAEALEKSGIAVDVVPQDNFNTENFLMLNATKLVSNQRILIFRGNGGRELLADTLRQRGAIVDYAEVYQRYCPSYENHQLISQDIDILVITSSEGLYNLYAIIKEDWIRDIPLLLASPRIKHAAKELGHKGKIITASNPSDAVVYHRLLDWAKDNN